MITEVSAATAREVVVRGARLRERRRRWAWVLLAALPAALLAVPVQSAQAEATSVPGTMSTEAVNTSTFAVPVPAGVEPRAITGVLTMPEVVEGGSVAFRVNGVLTQTVPSALYQKVRIPVGPADVIADGTIGLTMATQGPVAAGATCIPSGGVASMRKIELDYRGTEVAPTEVGAFFPPTSAGITVVIPEDAGDDMITAGLTAVAALAYRYDDDTPIQLSLTVPPAETATASQRVVALVDGAEDEVTTAVSTTSGIPLLTLTGTGDALVGAARVLSTETLGLSGTDAQNPSLEAKPRNTDRTRTFIDLGIDAVTLTGYGSTTQQVELRQDSFGVPVSSMSLHIEGSHTAFAEASGARLDVRANGDLVGSKVLLDDATFELDVTIPAGKLRAVNDLDFTLNALAPDGSACTPPGIPAAELDVDTEGSTVRVAHGTGQVLGFQLFPQGFEGTLPVALRSDDGRQASAAINAAALIATLQRAAGPPLEIQLMDPDAFLADDRSGLMVGAVYSDSVALDAPLELSATRLLDQENATVEVTSQEPYAALESIDRNDRLVLMLGSWAPGDIAAPAELARKVVDGVVNTGWDRLDGDLVIADEANPAFITASNSLVPDQVVEEEKSYVKWFALVIGFLLLLLALQVVIAIRRDRQVVRAPDSLPGDGPAYVEDEDYEVDALGDVDDLDVQEYDQPPTRRNDDPVAVQDHDDHDDPVDSGEYGDVDGGDEAYEEWDEDWDEDWEEEPPADEQVTEEPVVEESGAGPDDVELPFDDDEVEQPDEDEDVTEAVRPPLPQRKRKHT